jgi:flavin-binding protein dodecin
MMSFNDPRRAYDDRYYDGADYLRQGRLFDWHGQQGWGHGGLGLQQGWLGQPWEQRGLGFQQQPLGYQPYSRARYGEWSREAAWARAEAELSPMVKVIEVVAQSPHSWEDAVRRAVAEASQTIHGIRSVYIQDMQAVVEDEQVVCFRINAKISFTLDESRRRR